MSNSFGWPHPQNGHPCPSYPSWHWTTGPGVAQWPRPVWSWQGGLAGMPGVALPWPALPPLARGGPDLSGVCKDWLALPWATASQGRTCLELAKDWLACQGWPYPGQLWATASQGWPRPGWSWQGGLAGIPGMPGVALPWPALGPGQGGGPDLSGVGKDWLSGPTLHGHAALGHR
jgi:hypothetical protein